MKYKETYTWKDFDNDVESLTWEIAHDIQTKQITFTGIYGIPKGGLVLAVSLCNRLKLPLILNEKDVDYLVLVVDDISDTGETLKKFKEKGCMTATLYYKDRSTTEPDYWKRTKNDEWIIFPWEE